jgi:predicted dehydrogenase
LSAHGVDFFGRGLESAAFVTVYFSNNRIAHFNFNWFSPVKIRRTLIGGTKKMLVWNDLVPDEKVRIYDKGVDITSKDGIYDMLVQYRTGDMFAPKLDGAEALHKECQYFVDCINSGERPMNDGYAGLRIVKMLEACDQSLKQKGALIELAPSKLLV